MNKQQLSIFFSYFIAMLFVVPVYSNKALYYREKSQERARFYQEKTQERAQEEQKKVQLLQVWSAFLLGEVLANKKDLQEAIDCLNPENSKLEAKKSYLINDPQFISQCQKIKRNVKNWISSFTNMRLFLALSGPERQTFQGEYEITEGQEEHLCNGSTQELLEHRFLKDKMTVSIKHFVGSYEIKSVMETPLATELYPLTADEIEMAYGLRCYDTLNLKVEWDNKQGSLQRHEALSNHEKRARESLYKIENRKEYLAWMQAQRGKKNKEYKEKYYKELQSYPVNLFIQLPTSAFQKTYSIEETAWYPLYFEALKKMKNMNEDLMNAIHGARNSKNYDLLLTTLSYQEPWKRFKSLMEDEANNKNGTAITFLENVNDIESDWEDLEFNEDLKYIGALLGAGAACIVGPAKIAKFPFFKNIIEKSLFMALGRLPSWVGYATCTLGTGIGANLLFYDLTLGRYQNNYKQIFSVTGSTEFFLEISKYQDRELELFLESAFIFIGTGLPQIFSKLSHGTKIWLQKSRAVH